MPETTANYHRVPVRSKTGIMEDSIRTITISASEGIKALVGKASEGSSMQILTVLFPTDKFSMAEAKAWVKKHDLEDLFYDERDMDEGEFEPVELEAVEPEQGIDVVPGENVELAREEMTGEGARDKARSAQKSRASKHGIAILDQGHITKPSQWSHVPDSQFGDPVNYRYPMPDAAHARNAWARFNQEGASYRGRDKIRARILARCKHFGIEVSTESKAEIPAYVSRVILADDIPAEGDVKSWIEIHRVGTWDHPTYGKLSMTADMIRTIIDNFKAGVLGYEPSIDLHHQKSPAQGWIKDLAFKDGKLMALVNWTRAGVQNVRDKLYSYVSPEYTEDYEDRAGNMCGPALIGTALTNRPFLPGQTPLAMSEELEEEYFTNRVALSINAGKGKRMDEKVKSQVEEGAEVGQEARPEVVSLEEYQALQEKVKNLEDRRADDTRHIARLELEAKTGEVDAAVAAALVRGVDAYTINTVKAIILSLPRDGDATIRLEDGAEPVTLYRALMDFLCEVPGIVPQGSTSMENQTPPPKAGEIDQQEFDAAVNRVAGISA